MGEIILWTSIEGFKNLNNNKEFYAFSERTKVNQLQIIIPTGAIATLEKSPNPVEGIQFFCFKKELWKVGELL
jgi:hypothetical protein